MPKAEDSVFAYKDLSMKAVMRIAALSFTTILLCSSLSQSQEGARPSGRADTIRHISIYQSPSEYCAWPSIARTLGGDLIVLFTKTEEHLGPNGAILLSRSTDNGVTPMRENKCL